MYSNIIMVSENSIIKKCNKILVQHYTRCNTTKSERCSDYKLCKTFFKSKLSGYEPSYNPMRWEIPTIRNSHNCYTYFLNDHNKKTIQKCLHECNRNNSCNTKSSICSRFKPQPGKFSNIINKSFTCNGMETTILKDNSSIFKTSFSDRCPKKYYKGAMVIHPNKTYHFYRQNPNSTWSHKPGILSVTNKDSDGNIIFNPKEARRNYKKDSENGIHYSRFCSYYCIPTNSFLKTNSI